MIEVKELRFEEVMDPGCNNGNWQPATVITFDSDEKVVREHQIITCRCGKGCSGTDRCPDVGMTFKNLGSLLDWMYE